EPLRPGELRLRGLHLGPGHVALRCGQGLLRPLRALPGDILQPGEHAGGLAIEVLRLPKRADIGLERLVDPLLILGRARLRRRNRLLQALHGLLPLLRELLPDALRAADHAGRKLLHLLDRCAERPRGAAALNVGHQLLIRPALTRPEPEEERRELLATDSPAPFPPTAPLPPPHPAREIRAPLARK